MKKQRNAEEMLRDLRSAESKREKEVLNRIRTDALQSGGRETADGLVVAMRDRRARRLSRHA